MHAVLVGRRTNFPLGSEWFVLRRKRRTILPQSPQLEIPACAISPPGWIGLVLFEESCRWKPEFADHFRPQKQGEFTRCGVCFPKIRNLRETACLQGFFFRHNLDLARLETKRDSRGACTPCSRPLSPSFTSRGSVSGLAQSDCDEPAFSSQNRSVRTCRATGSALASQATMVGLAICFWGGGVEPDGGGAAGQVKDLH